MTDLQIANATVDLLNELRNRHIEPARAKARASELANQCTLVNETLTHAKYGTGPSHIVDHYCNSETVEFSPAT